MKYISTRDVSDVPRRFSFLDAVLEGLAPDGGLLVPETVPQVTAEELVEFRSLSYTELCANILREFIDPEEVSDSELGAMITSAYASFEQPDVVAPVVTMGSVKVMELFQGPTYAFKDVALQLLGHLFDFALKKRGTRMTILGATSGDTGSAAIAGTKGRANIDCVILFPLGKTSKIQELQMTSNLDANIHCLAVEDSVFDDCQSIVKACFGDAGFNAEMSLGAVNSINWARILAQVVYYAHASLGADKTTFVVPTGNFGNMLAGYYAKRMGFPIDKLVIASNTNDILPRFFETGSYKLPPSVIPTMSPSMDIAISSNFERYLFDLFGRNAKEVKSKFDEIATKREFSVTPAQLEEARSTFASFSVNEDRTLATIKSVYAECGYLLCPHSAVGYAVASDLAKQPTAGTIITLATAHIGKFTEHILAQLGDSEDEAFKKAVVDSVPLRLKSLETAKTKRIDIPNTVDAVKSYLRDHVKRR